MKLKVLFIMSVLFGCLSLSLVLKSAEKKDWNGDTSTTVNKDDNSKTVDLGEGYTRDRLQGGITIKVDEPRPHKVENVKHSYDGKTEIWYKGWKSKGSGSQDIIIYQLDYSTYNEEEHTPVITGDVSITDTSKSKGNGKKADNWGFDVTTEYNIIHCKNYSCTNDIVPWDPDTKNLIPYISSGAPYKTNEISFDITSTTTWGDIHQALVDSAIIVGDSPAYGSFNAVKKAQLVVKEKEFLASYDCEECGRNKCIRMKYLFDYNFSTAFITIPKLSVDTNLINEETMVEWNELVTYVTRHENIHRENLLKYVLLVIKPSEFRYVHCLYSKQRKRDYLEQYARVMSEHRKILESAYAKKADADSSFDAQEMIYNQLRQFFHGNSGNLVSK